MKESRTQAAAAAATDMATTCVVSVWYERALLALAVGVWIGVLWSATSQAV